MIVKENILQCGQDKQIKLFNPNKVVGLGI